MAKLVQQLLVLLLGALLDKMFLRDTEGLEYKRRGFTSIILSISYTSSAFSYTSSAFSYTFSAFSYTSYPHFQNFSDLFFYLSQHHDVLEH